MKIDLPPSVFKRRDATAMEQVFQVVAKDEVSKKSLTDQLVDVQLDDADRAEFLRYFFNNDRKSDVSIYEQYQRKAVFHLYDVNATIGLLNMIVATIFYYTKGTDFKYKSVENLKTELNSRVSAIVSSFYDKAYGGIDAKAQKRTMDSKIDMLESFLKSNTSAGYPYIRVIDDPASKAYQIIMSGISTSGSQHGDLLYPSKDVFELTFNLPVSRPAEREAGTAFEANFNKMWGSEHPADASDDVKAIRNAANDLLEAHNATMTKLFGAATISNAHSRVTNTTEQSVNLAERINKISNNVCAFIQTHFGFTPEIDPLKDAGVDSHITPKYLRAAPLRLPNAKAFDFARATMRRQDESNQPTDFNQSSFHVPAFFISSACMFVPAFILPYKFARYVTQTKVGDKISKANLDIWAAKWVMGINRWSSAKNLLKLSDVPPYVLPASRVLEMQQRRKKLGMFSEQGRTDDENISIGSDGNLMYMPKATEMSMDAAKAYEASMEQFAEMCDRIGSPLAASTKISDVYLMNDKHVGKQVEEAYKGLKAIGGTSQVYDWDLNVALRLSEDGMGYKSTKLGGSTKPTSLNIAKYMKSNFGAGIADSFSWIQTVVPGEPPRYINETTYNDPRNLANFPPLQYALFGKSYGDSLYKRSLYNWLAAKQLVPGVEQLIQEAAVDLGIKSLGDEGFADFEMMNGRPIYGVLKPDLTLIPRVTLSPTAEDGSNTLLNGTILQSLFAATVINASGGPRTTLGIWAQKESIEIDHDDSATQLRPDANVEFDEPEDHELPRYFNASLHTLGEFSKLYNWFGGRVIYRALQHLLKVDPKVLQNMQSTPDNPAVNFEEISRSVMPIVKLLGKYVPERERIYKEAAEEHRRNTDVTAYEAEDLKFPGSRAGFQLFPHQVKALCALRNFPRFAVLDVAPGGGKTTIGAMDIVQAVAYGGIKRPMVLAPNGLLRNWAEDLHAHTNGSWNIVCVDTEAYNSWGDDRLTQIVQKAPVNTIFAFGYEATSRTKKTDLVIGTFSLAVSATLEFIKKFGFDYVILDESHRIKNESSNLHDCAVQICTISTVKMVRLATGTLISNDMDDVVGQTSVFTGQVFRTKSDFRNQYMEGGEDMKGKGTAVFSPDTPVKARKRLAEYATVISAKRKDWAFMLPIPIERFINVDFINKDMLASGQADPAGEAFKLLYDSVLNEVLDQAAERLKQLKAIRDEESRNEFLQEGQEPGDEEIDESGDSDSDSGAGEDAVLRPYIQRLERLLTDPLGDPDLDDEKEVVKRFKQVAGEGFRTPKVKKVIDTIYKHFQVPEWSRGQTYRAIDVVRYAGKTYMLAGGQKRGSSVDYQTGLAPDQPNNKWEEHYNGKVLVVCRYTRSVNAIFNALPPDLKKRSVMFHGDLPDGLRKDNLYRFMNDDKVDVLIANEMAISEGYNMQMAGRMVRVEIPWAPGSLDQTMSRLFRPDPSQRFKRSVIFLDWVICDNSIEVRKAGRLIDKLTRSIAFSETGNPRYSAVTHLLKSGTLKPVTIDIKTMREGLYTSLEELASVGGVGGFANNSPHPTSYMGAYGQIVAAQAEEFRELRVTQSSVMHNVEPTPPLPESKKMPFVPMVRNQHIYDSENDGLRLLSDILSNEHDPLTLEVRRDPRSALLDQVVFTEFGYGVIEGIQSQRNFAQRVAGGELSHTAINLASVNIRIYGDKGGTRSVKPNKCFICGKLTVKDLRNRPRGIFVNDTELKSQEVIRTASQKVNAPKPPAPKPAKPTSTIAPPKPPRQSQPAGEKAPRSAGQHVVLHAVIYNNFLALEGVTGRESDKFLQPYGFEKFGKYAYLPIKNGHHYDEVLYWLDQNFQLSEANWTKLEQVEKALGKGNKTPTLQLAADADLQNFHKTVHTLVKQNKNSATHPVIRVMPMMVNGHLLLAIDIATNPSFRSRIGKKLKGVEASNAIWKVADGVDIAFFENRAELVQAVKAMRTEGQIIVDNMDELKEEVTRLHVLMQHARPTKPATNLKVRPEGRREPLAAKPVPQPQAAKPSGLKPKVSVPLKAKKQSRR